MVLASVVGNRVGHITQLCVDPACQGSGIGLSLLCRTLQRLQERGFRAVTLSVTASNHKALRLYERLSFSTLKDFYAFAWDAPARVAVASAKQIRVR
jgi:ribosomal protein S18 acetylase RimI-like enzyme